MDIGTGISQQVLAALPRAARMIEKEVENLL